MQMVHFNWHQRRIFIVYLILDIIKLRSFENDFLFENKDFLSFIFKLKYKQYFK